jgi:hypothetical protein
MNASLVIPPRSRTEAKPAEVTATSRVLCAVPMLFLGCAEQPGYGEAVSASTVSGATTAGGCSTATVLGLSRQIADEIACENGGSLVRFDGGAGVVLTSNAVLPYLEQDAADDLARVAANNSLQINSAFRTIAQQYLLYHWYLRGSCGIAAAATVGNSNHESGRAVDVANWSSRVSAMSAHGWRHDVPGDVVHFDHTASADIRGQDVRAFQTLWNRNHPEDPIAADGSYGPHTAARLEMAPATGFAQGASCTTRSHAELVAVDGPDRVAPLTRAHYTISLANGGDADWPATTQLAITGTSSPLYDASWQSQTVIATLGAPIAAGTTGDVEIDVTTPAVTADTPISQTIAIADGATTYGTVTVALTVEADVDTTTSSDGDDHQDLGEVTGGCNAGGGGAGLLVLLAFAGISRSRRGRRSRRRPQASFETISARSAGS